MVGNKYLHLFEDQVLLFEGENTLYEKLDAGKSPRVSFRRI